MSQSFKGLLALFLACAAFTGCGPGAASPSAPSASAGGGSAPVESGEIPESASHENGTEIPVEEEKPRPVYGDEIENGVYPIKVASSSSMFRITDALLTVADGQMTCALTLSGTGYEKLFMGTGEEALAGPDSACIYFVESPEGKYTYEVPVAALNQDIECAAWSIRKKKWYDRTLVFESADIPPEALAAGPAARRPADGRYEIAAALSGGSGRAQVASPAQLTVRDGAVTATVAWSSPYYEEMTVGGVSYGPVSTGGNAVFEIPVSLDRDIAVTARTTAMSEPHDIEYILRFDSATMKLLEK